MRKTVYINAKVIYSSVHTFSVYVLRISKKTGGN